MTPVLAHATSALAELQGLYGPYAFPELLLQKLWWRREFDVDQARTADGRPVRVLSPGRWNRLGGPDFRDAVIDLGAERVRGAVEVHLRAEDWAAHRHAANRAYDGVVLHVVLFPPKHPYTAGTGGRAIPILALLPLLWHDLEEYAADEAVAALLNRAEHRIASELAPLPPAILHERLLAGARRRWSEKVRYAQTRLERLGWDHACHHAALEILGYRANRVGMLRIATAWPLARWTSGEADPAALFEEHREHWALQGVRPANHPRRRLRQYHQWVRSCPDWPQVLENWARRQAAPRHEAGALPIGTGRRELGFPAAWIVLLQVIGAGSAVARPRADHLVGDGFLPLLTARGCLNPRAAFAWWWQGYPGDLPDPIQRALRELGLSGTGASPAALGPAQGLLAWLLEQSVQSMEGAPVVARQGA